MCGCTALEEEGAAALLTRAALTRPCISDARRCTVDEKLCIDMRTGMAEGEPELLQESLDGRQPPVAERVGFNHPSR